MAPHDSAYLSMPHLQMALSQTLRLLQAYDMTAVRCHMDNVEDPGNGVVTMLRVLVEPAKDHHL